MQSHLISLTYRLYTVNKWITYLTFQKPAIRAGNLREITGEFSNCEASILHKRSRTSSTRSSIMMDDQLRSLSCIIMLSTCCKLPAPATHYIPAHDVRPIDLAQLTMNFDHRYALCIQKLSQAALHTRWELE